MILFVLVCMMLMSPALSRAQVKDTPLKVMSFNAWLLDIPVYPFGFRKDVSEEMNERIQKMPAKIAETGADVVVFQEVWSQSSKDTLIREMKKFGYGFAAYTQASNWFLFFQVAMGDGLLVLSKFPISNHVEIHDFSKATQSVEAFASKGVMKLLIKHPSLGWIDLYAAHLGAVDFENGDYNQKQMKLHDQQLEELSAFVKSTRSHSVTMLAADLNMHYKKWDRSTAHPQFVNQFSDSYLKLLHNTCGQGQDLSDTYFLTHQKTIQDEPDYTFDQKNNYVTHGYYDSLPSEVEDYIFVCDNHLIAADSSQLVFKGDSHLSDHYGLVSSFHWTDVYTSPIVHLATSDGQSLAAKAGPRKGP